MLIDVSQPTGFHAVLNTDTLALESQQGFVFRHDTRKAEALQNVLRSPDAVPGDTVIYHLYYPEAFPAGARKQLDRYHLTYSFVLVPPIVVGEEFAKTSGHYHPYMPGSTYSYPEVYTGLYGRLLLLLQKRSRANARTPLDCALVELKPGVSVTIPPDYAHVLINPTGDLTLMAGLYSAAFKPDYAEVYQQRGLAYYLLQNGGGMKVEANPLYENAPPLRVVSDFKGTVFEPPDDPQIPVWESYLRQPDRYAFLAQPEAAKTRFG